MDITDLISGEDSPETIKFKRSEGHISEGGDRVTSSTSSTSVGDESTCSGASSEASPASDDECRGSRGSRIISLGGAVTPALQDVITLGAVSSLPLGEKASSAAIIKLGCSNAGSARLLHL